MIYRILTTRDIEVLRCFLTSFMSSSISLVTSPCDSVHLFQEEINEQLLIVEEKTGLC